jgi:hypothetical protein
MRANTLSLGSGALRSRNLRNKSSSGHFVLNLNMAAAPFVCICSLNDAELVNVLYAAGAAFKDFHLISRYPRHER